jgi:hypothetical protein
VTKSLGDLVDHVSKGAGIRGVPFDIPANQMLSFNYNILENKL